MQVFILGAAKPSKNQWDDQSHLLIQKLIKGQRVLDWTIKTLNESGIPTSHIYFVGGYEIEKIISLYPDLNYVVNPRWNETHVVGSLRYAMKNWKGNEVLILFADTLYRSVVFSEVLKLGEEIVCGIDTLWKTRISKRNLLNNAEKVVLENDEILRCGRNSISVKEADAQFTGLLFFNAEKAKKLNDLFVNGTVENVHRPLNDNDSFTDLIGYIKENWGSRISIFDTANQWAELDSKEDLAKFIFGTKAETLERIKLLVTKSLICDQIHFNLSEWELQSKSILENIQQVFKNQNLIIRSSSIEEDSWDNSQAGAFDSVADVDANSPKALLDAITTVIGAYKKKGSKTYNQNNQVLVQPFIKNVDMSGVAFTRHLEKGTPYYLINYDDTSGRTDTITSGSIAQSKSIIIYEKASKANIRDKRLKQIKVALDELRKVLGHNFLDVEFVLTNAGELFIVQVRPITLHTGKSEEIDFKSKLKREKKFLKARFAKYPHIYGDTTILADMPDWNPAEMISIKPNPLALSLYKYLITDHTWRVARGKMGYHNPEFEKLLFTVGGHPYIDVRNSFNNLIPENLPTSLANKLINHYVRRLKDNPQFHDKVEFEIVITCYTPDIDRHLKRLENDGFDSNEIESLKQALRVLTENAITDKLNPIDTLIKQTESLENKSASLMGNKTKVSQIPNVIQYLLDDCIANGTIPFSILARYGFIASSMLRGLVAVGAITEKEKHDYLNSIDTIAGELVHDMEQVNSNRMELAGFLKKYGHLRPGTYDINSFSYKEKPNYYFKTSSNEETDISRELEQRQTFEFSDATKNRIKQAISDMDMSFTVDQLLKFIKNATAGREYAKFNFTRNIDLIFDLLVKLGKKHNIQRSDLAFLSIQDIVGLSDASVPFPETTYLRQKIEEGKLWYEQANKLETPQIFTTPKDLEVIERTDAKPNFVTNKVVQTEVCILKPNTDKLKLEGRIVVIEGADPGYDWIFMHNIAGLVTKYGGAASHMTIRCAEFGLPAAIGCGEELFEKISTANRIELNCNNETINCFG